MRALMSVRRRGRGVALVTLLAVARVSAQNPAPAPQPEQPTFRANVNLVRVDVSVFTGDGTPIADLQAADFRVLEDDVPQTVETVQFVSLNGQAIPGSNESLTIRSPEHARLEASKDDVRLFALYLDDYHVDKLPAITLPLRSALEHFVDQLGPRDLVALMDPLTPLTHLRFTRSREELLERVRTFEGRRGERFPVRSILEEAQLQAPNLWEIRAGVSLSALTALVTYLGGLREGRKSVIFVSQGPPVRSPSDPNYARLEEAVEAANRGNVTINVLDPRPLGSSEIGGPESLRRLSHDTGGRAIVNTNDHKRGLRQIVTDASAYYLVGYTPTREAADGKFHRIDVEVRRRGVRVLARRGYWAPSAEELTPKDEGPPPEPKLTAALSTFSAPSSGRIVDTWVGFDGGGSGNGRVLLTWEPAARRAASGAAARLSVEPLTKAGGDAVGAAQVIASATSTGGDAAVAAFELDPRMSVLRVTALDEKGDVLDRWTEPIDRPTSADGALVLSTPRVFRARSQFEQRALTSNPNPVPVASRVFRATDRVLIEIACTSGCEEAPAVTAELTNAKGERLIELAVPALADGKARIALPLTSLAPSVYAVRFRAGDGEREARQVVAFRVER